MRTGTGRVTPARTGRPDCVRAGTRVDLASEAKVISYLRTTGLRLGLLLNFNKPTLREGIKRIVC